MGGPQTLVLLEAARKTTRKDNLIENMATQGQNILNGFQQLQVCVWSFLQMLYVLSVDVLQLFLSGSLTCSAYF